MLVSVLVAVGVSAVLTVIFQVYYRKNDSLNVQNLLSRIESVELNLNASLEQFSSKLVEYENHCYYNGEE